MHKGHGFSLMSLSIAAMFLFIVLYPVPTASAALKGTVVRLWGDDRFQTACAISQEGWKTSQHVILTIGEGDDKFADALSGASLAVLLDAPILLTGTKEINDATINEITRLGANSIYILGGTGVISDKVKTELQDMGKTVTRISGKDRYETAIKIASELRKHKPFTKVMLTTGSQFQYAMMSAPFAARDGIPVLFTQKEVLTKSIRKALADWSIKNVEIIGSSSVVSDAVVNELKAMGINIVRIEGQNIQETNMNVVKFYCPQVKGIALARDDLFADGLAGGPMAAKLNIPIILVGKGTTVENLAFYTKELDKHNSYILGGPGAISHDLADSLMPVPDIAADGEIGNTHGNIANGGIAAIQDDWIFFSHVSNDGKLYKTRLDGTCFTMLSDNKVRNLNISEDWIYYTNESDKNRLYKIKTDGSENVKICDDRPLFPNLVGEWIYYINYNDNKTVYRIRTDGTGRMKLCSDQSYFLSVSGNWIYFCNREDSSKIYRMRTDGSNITSLCNDRSSYINVDGGWIYYCNHDDENRIYKMRTDGSRKTRISNDAASYLNISGNYIYYSNSSKGSVVSRIKLDGSEKETLNFDISRSITIVDGWLYYFNEDTQMFYKMKLDGTERQPVYSKLTAPLTIPQI